jgi:polysaccharide deacetylase 2 family uncharacterized protein YibQ
MAKKRKKRKELKFVLIALCSVAIILAILVGYVGRLEKEAPPLPYEEVYATSGRLSRDIRLVDKAISDGFCAVGVPSEDIVFLSVIPRYDQGFHWDFNSIEVTIPKGNSLVRAGEAIRSRVAALSIPVKIAEVQHSPGEITYHIYCRGLFTHRLKLVGDGMPLPERLARPRIGIIIDDLGYDSSLAHAFMALDIPLTLSVLPFTPNSRAIAQRARYAGCETMLHLPMEPIGYPSVNPGDGVLLISMDKETILEVLNDDLKQTPFVAGANNHMGSRFTENAEKMAIVLEELKKQDLYFVDSRTNSGSVAFKKAQEMALRAAKRDIFLDNDLSENALKIQMERLLSLARHKGRAIGIGHPHQETLGLLKKYQSVLTDETELVPISRLVN